MPEASAGHAARISQSTQSSQMEQSAPRRLLDEPGSSPRPSAHFPAVDEASIAVSEVTKEDKKRINKKSLDYIIRSGVAGGLAGCAVSTVDNITGALTDNRARQKQSSDRSIE